MTRRQRWTLVATVIGSGAVFLDGTIVNVALKHDRPGAAGHARRRPRGPGLRRQRLPRGPRRAAHPGRRAVATTTAGAASTRIGLAGFARHVRAVRAGADARVAGRLPPAPGRRRRAAHPRVARAHHPRVRGPGARPRVRHLGGVDLGARRSSGRSSAAILVDTLGWRVAFLINVPLLAFALWATRDPRRGVARHRDDRPASTGSARSSRRSPSAAWRSASSAARRTSGRTRPPGSPSPSASSRSSLFPILMAAPPEPARAARAVPLAGVRDRSTSRRSSSTAPCT